MNSPSSQPDAFTHVFVARQPIFTTKRDIWAYELLFRNSKSNPCAAFPDANQATWQVIADGYTLARAGIRSETRTFINFPEQLLREDSAFALPPETSVIEVLEDVEPDSEIRDRLVTLKKHGYTIALDDYVGRDGYESFIEVADIIKVDILGMETRRIKEIVKRLKPYGCRLLAEKVEDSQTFEACRSMGFELFQGFFFSRPQIIPGYKLSSSQLSRLKLLKELSTEDFEMSRLSKIVQSDVSLSYRLLQYINSTHFSTLVKVESIPRALGLLGRRNIQQWLRVTIMADLNTSDSGKELMWLSVTRGRFLQLLAEQKSLPFSPRAMFIMGLFSLLDALLGQPMEKILKDIPLEEGIKACLIDPEASLCPWLTFLTMEERGQWAESNDLLNKEGVSPFLAAELGLQAQQWATNMLKEHT
jgi:c-di-GMP phosphodiesterase